MHTRLRPLFLIMLIISLTTGSLLAEAGDRAVAGHTARLSATSPDDGEYGNSKKRRRRLRREAKKAEKEKALEEEAAHNDQIAAEADETMDMEELEEVEEGDGMENEDEVF